MAARAAGDLLLVGSLPADTTESALRAAAGLFGDLTFALPDGETGPRAAWVGYDTATLIAPHPDTETVRPTDSPTGHPRHLYENPVYRLRPGVSELRFDRWPRIDDLRSEEDAFLRPLADLSPGGARVFPGIILPLDGVPGLRRRHATVSRYRDDFGVAMYCGFGRQPGADGIETMREHRRVALEVAGAARP